MEEPGIREGLTCAEGVKHWEPRWMCNFLSTSSVHLYGQLLSPSDSVVLGLCHIISCCAMRWYSGTWVHELNFFCNFGKDLYISVCVGKMAAVVSVTQCSLQTKLSPKDSVCEPNSFQTKPLCTEAPLSKGADIIGDGLSSVHQYVLIWYCYSPSVKAFLPYAGLNLCDQLPLVWSSLVQGRHLI